MSTQRKIAAWRLTWQSPSMAAPAFWYFKSYERARNVAGDMAAWAGYRAELARTRVPESACMDRP